MEKIILMGSGGHCKVIIESILLGKKYEIVGIIDLKEKLGTKVLNVPVIGCDHELEDYFKRGIRNCFIAIGSLYNPALRVKLARYVLRIGYNMPNLLHPTSSISKSVKLGRGNYISSGVIINSGAVIGDNCIINTGAIIEHDCNIGDFVHIASGAAMSGGVTISECSHIGTGSSIAHCIKIGKNSIIGSGSVVVKDIKDNIIAYGNPCKAVRDNV